MAAGKKLLVADDSLTIQKVIRLALSNEGYEIQAISDGADAIQQISLFRPDLVLVDVSLPTLSAFDIKRQVNTMEDFANTRFVLMSSAFEKIDEDQAKEVGFQGRLTKPFDPAHLRQVLQEVLSIPVAAPARRTSNTSPSLAKPTTSPSIAKPTTSPSIAKPAPPPVAPPSGFPNLDLEMPKTPESAGIHLEPPSGFPEPGFSLEKEEEFTPPPLPEQTGFTRRERGEASALQGGPNLDHEASHNTIDEIKHLTESTIRMSGLDDFDWQVNDAGLKPPSSLGDDGGTSFNIRSDKSNPAIERPQFAQGGYSGPSTPSSSSQSAGSAQTGSYNAPRASAPSAGQSVSNDEIEAMVRRQVQDALEHMARKILPEVAERVIKAEIHKLLNEK